MNNWEKFKLEEITDRICVGYVGSCQKDYTVKGKGVMMIRTTNLDLFKLDLSAVQYISKEFHEKNKKSQLKKNDILIARHGDNGKASMYELEEEANCLNVVIIRPDENKANSKFLLYLINSPMARELILSQSSGSVQDVINTRAIAELKLPIPPLPAQTRIASILSSLDDKIELNRRTNHTLEQMAQTLFKKYFVTDIDPDNLPEGWRWGKLGEILSFRNGKSSPKRNDLSIYPVFGSNGIIGFCDISNANERSLIIGRVGSFCGSVYYCLQKSFVTDNAIIAETIFDNTSTYCFVLLLSLNLNNYRGGSGQPLVNQTVLSNIEVIIPDIKVVNEYEKIAYSFYSRIFQNEAENNNLSKIRDTLLPKLMSGEITVN